MSLILIDPEGPAWTQPTRLDWWTWELDAKACHCRVRLFRDGQREYKLCARHSLAHILQGQLALEDSRAQAEGDPQPRTAVLLATSEAPIW